MTDIKDRYIIREVCGEHYLIDIRQDGASYRSPNILNSSAAYIIGRLLEGDTPEVIAEELSDEEVSRDEIYEDIMTLVSEIGV